MNLKDVKVGSTIRINPKGGSFEIKLAGFSKGKKSMRIYDRNGLMGWLTTDDYELLEVLEG